jgi:hypothetical protein
MEVGIADHVWSIEEVVGLLAQEPMDLKTFVREALVEIVQAVQEAQKATIGMNALINPSGVKPAGRAQTAHGRGVEDVHFDIAVTVEAKTAGEAGFKVLGLGLGADLSDSESRASRVKFTVPVCWPESSN